jgi:hypothetical protein
MKIFGLENKVSLNGIDELVPEYQSVGTPHTKLLFPELESIN